MREPIVAIVGRPNVGKSTLFNRIVGGRTAIVDDRPGVTRDRHYGRTEWAGKPFTLVDTGGFVPESSDVFEVAIREQAQIAIEEADLVLFVVDAVTGALPIDQDIAAILRRSAKPVVLVLNKADGEKREGMMGEFFALGLGDPVPVSALVGRKVGDMLDVVTAGFAASGAEGEEDGRLKLAIIGKPNVGKSSLVNALLQQDRHIVTPIPGTTRDPIDTILRFHGEEILLIDTAGLRRRSKIKESIEFYSAVRTLKSIERCDTAVVLLDARQGLEHQDLRIIDTALERRKGTLLAVNKWDAIEKDSSTAALYKRQLRERLRAYNYLPVVFISALQRQRVYRVIEMAKAVRREMLRRIPTSELNVLMQQAIAAHAPRSASGKEVKIKYMSQVRADPPVFTFFCNDPRLIDETYRRYLENKIRERYGFPGVPLLITFKRK
jgi:GTP-binding protein